MKRSWIPSSGSHEMCCRYHRVRMYLSQQPGKGFMEIVGEPMIFTCCLAGKEGHNYWF